MCFQIVVCVCFLKSLMSLYSFRIIYNNSNHYKNKWKCKALWYKGTRVNWQVLQHPPMEYESIQFREYTITILDYCSNMSKNAQNDKVQSSCRFSDSVFYFIIEPLGICLFSLSSCSFLLQLICLLCDRIINLAAKLHKRNKTSK